MNIIFYFNGYNIGRSLMSLGELRCSVGCWEVRLFVSSCEFDKDEVLARTSVE